MPMRKMLLENVVEKGEHAGNWHFLLFSTMFSTIIVMEDKFNVLSKFFTSHPIMLSIQTRRKVIVSERVEITVEKGENACYKHFHLFE